MKSRYCGKHEIDEFPSQRSSNMVRKIRLQDLNFNFIRNLIVRHFISRCLKREKSHDEKSKSYYLL